MCVVRQIEEAQLLMKNKKKSHWDEHSVVRSKKKVAVDWEEGVSVILYVKCLWAMHNVAQTHTQTNMSIDVEMNNIGDLGICPIQPHRPFRVLYIYVISVNRISLQPFEHCKPSKCFISGYSECGCRWIWMCVCVCVFVSECRVLR